jgi:hypothetical protein
VPGIVQRASDVAARVLLRPATVVSVGAHGAFRMIELGGDRLTGVEWTPGDKIRVRGDGLALRTYTPVSGRAITSSDVPGRASASSST